MGEEIEGTEGLKGLFESILGANVKIKDNIDTTEELIFNKTIQKLEDSHILENNLIEDYGICINQITDPLWEIIETNFTHLYGEDTREIIMWYIYERFNPDGEITPLETEDGKQFLLKNVNDLWSYIKYKVK
tara:strand:+ start:1073 stop:1468 length:396 start_codon:yes stop_codon:yes gene_type:complete